MTLWNTDFGVGDVQLMIGQTRAKFLHIARRGKRHRVRKRAIDIEIVRIDAKGLDGLDAARDVRLARPVVDRRAGLDFLGQVDASEQAHRARRDRHLHLRAEIPYQIFEL